MKTIAIYGSAMVQPGEPDYDASYAVGQALARGGYAVMTGGYAGVMGAASHGASSAGGHVIGVTTGAVERLRGPEVQMNAWVTEKVHYDTLHERLMHLVRDADGYVVMPGGLGTLTELAMVWELMRVRDIPQRPFILYGRYWRDMLSELHTSPYVRQTDWHVFTYVDSPDAVVSTLDTSTAQTEQSTE